MGRGRPKLVRNRQSSDSPGGHHKQASRKQLLDLGPLATVAENMTNEDVDRAIEDAEKDNTEIHIKEIKGKVFQNKYETPKRGEEEEKVGKMHENFQLELRSNLSSSIEIEQETKEQNLRRSKRLKKKFDR